MRRTPLYDNLSEPDDRDDRSNVQPITTPSTVRTAPRGNVRYVRGARRMPPRRGRRWRTWIISGALGVAILSGVWLGLMLAFPPFERASVQQAAKAPADSAPAGGPESAAASAATPPPAAQAQPTEVTGPERLPGLATPVPPAGTSGGPAAAESKPEAGQAQASAKPEEAQAAATPEDGQQPAAASPAEGAPPSEQAAETPAEAQPAAPASQSAEQASAPTEANTEPSAEAEPGPGTPAPIPPPEDTARAPRPAPEPPVARAQQPEATVARAAAPAAPPPPRQQPAQKPAAAPPPPASGRAFAISASVSPANPVSENAVVTVSVRATQNGTPVAGAFCMATIYYRTATVRQPAGGFTTGANGVGSFVLDAKGTTYGFTVPIDVTCSGRGGSASARTSFTPVRGR